MWLSPIGQSHCHTARIRGPPPAPATLRPFAGWPLPARRGIFIGPKKNGRTTCCVSVLRSSCVARLCRLRRPGMIGRLPRPFHHAPGRRRRERQGARGRAKRLRACEANDAGRESSCCASMPPPQRLLRKRSAGASIKPAGRDQSADAVTPTRGRAGRPIGSRASPDAPCASGSATNAAASIRCAGQASR